MLWPRAATLARRNSGERTGALVERKHLVHRASGDRFLRHSEDHAALLVLSDHPRASGDTVVAHAGHDHADRFGAGDVREILLDSRGIL